MYRAISLLVISVILSGCATYGSGIKQSLELTKKGDFTGAQAIIKKELNPEGKDRILYYMELGVLEHLAGNYQASTQMLENAERIGEDLYTKRAGELLAVAMTSPRMGPYRGANYERVLINYYKAMNFLMLGQQAETRSVREDALEGARIEVRRLEMNLTAIANEKGSYQAQKDEDQALFSKLTKIFNALNGDFLDKGKLVYRQDAWANYLSGLTYEQNGEYDDARISYQKAAKLYEDGFQEQYELDKNITEQAWFDTIRMMRKAGGWDSEWPRLAKKKLSKKRRSELKTFDQGAQVVVIEHVGFAPHRKELNLNLSVDADNKELVLAPVLTGTQQDREEQFAWFFMMYADKGILGLIQNYNTGGINSAIEGFFSTKRVGIAPMWNIAEGLGLIGALSQGNIRVTVPYYAPFKTGPGESVLNIGSKKYPLVSAESIAQLALQEQLLSAPDDMTQALAREALKAVATQKVAENAGQYGQLFSFAGKIASFASSQAETRNWLTLPYEMRVTRVSVEAGEHLLKLNSKPNPLRPAKVSETQVNLKKGEIFVWKQRSVTGNNIPKPVTTELRTAATY